MSEGSTRRPADGLSAFARRGSRRRSPRVTVKALVRVGIAVLTVAACLVAASRWLRLAPSSGPGRSPATSPEGRVAVESRPSGARVEIDGQPRGSTPLAVRLPAGRHVLAVIGATRREMDIVVDAGAEVTHHVEVPDVAMRGPAAGWLSVTAPIEVEIYDGGQLVGRGRRVRVLLTAGRHELSLVNRELGYEDRRALTVVANQTRNVKVQPGTGVLSADAIPRAEVFLDGRWIGATPVADYAVALGSHELLFRHPELGEQRRTVVVGRTAPARIVVNFLQ